MMFIFTNYRQSIIGVLRCQEQYLEFVRVHDVSSSASIDVSFTSGLRRQNAAMTIINNNAIGTMTDSGIRLFPFLKHNQIIGTCV